MADVLKRGDTDGTGDSAAVAHLLRRHAFTLSFEQRSSDGLGSLIQLLGPLLRGGPGASGGRKEAAGAIMNLTWRSTHNADVACSTGVVPLLTQLAGRADADSAEVENAAGALLNIVAHSGGHSIARARVVRNSGAVRHAWARLLVSGKNKWSRLGCKLLAGVVGGEPTLAEPPSMDAAAEAMATGGGIPWEQMLLLGMKPDPKSSEVETQLCALAAITAVAYAMGNVTVDVVRDVITEERYMAFHAHATPPKLLPLLKDRRLALAEAAAK